MRQKMVCEKCGMEMNFHAEKIDYIEIDPTKIDPDFGGVVEEAHTCPGCGKTATRPTQK